ncbi:nucleoside 2-deoxyribosyltransferase [Candidatus Falkowbacteria bacterium]|nr:nucleoside 2-deoxyribosyltransferase [Candidatus Falkowbacteria bacterium]
MQQHSHGPLATGGDMPGQQRKRKKRLRIYLAGGLFNSAERVRNMMLAEALEELGYVVILPQVAALNRFSNGRFDIAGVVVDCTQASTDPKNITVACLDGADADSGMAVEFGMALTATGRAIGYRTDFRTALEQEVGINAMFRGKGAIIIYHPCFITTQREMRQFYRELAQEIDAAIQTAT